MRSDYYTTHEPARPAVSTAQAAPAPPIRRPRRALLVFLLFLLALALGTGLLAFLTYLDEEQPPSPALTELEVDSTRTTTLPLSSPPGEALFSLAEEVGDVLSPAEIYAQTNPAVVSILADFGDGSAASGTGVLFDPQGYLVTNTHIIEGAQSAVVTLPSGGSFSASLVGMDVETDLAVLKLSSDKPFPTAVFGSDTTLAVGDPAYAIGNPLGSQFQGSMTDGIISAINRNVTVGDRQMTLIQTSAALNSGNSGGALLNDRGQVVGITNLKMMSTSVTVEGLGFAIPSTTVKRVVNSILLTGEAVGEPVLGITVRPATEEESTQGGLMVVEVDSNSDAWAKGLRPGHLLLRANGVLLWSNQDLLTQRTGLEIGETLELVWLSETMPMLHVEQVALMDKNQLS